MLVAGCGDNSGRDTPEPETSTVVSPSASTPSSPAPSAVGIVGSTSVPPPEPVLVTVTPSGQDVSADMQGPIASVRTGPDGTFRLDVPPGTYTVAAAGPLTCEPVEVEVREGYARVDVPCRTA